MLKYKDYTWYDLHLYHTCILDLLHCVTKLKCSVWLIRQAIVYIYKYRQLRFFLQYRYIPRIQCNVKKITCFSVFDAMGKPGSGIFEGNFKWLGSYSECVAVEAVDNDGGVVQHPYKGKHCQSHMYTVWHHYNIESSYNVVAFILYLRIFNIVFLLFYTISLGFNFVTFVFWLEFYRSNYSIIC